MSQVIGGKTSKLSFPVSRCSSLLTKTYSCSPHKTLFRYAYALMKSRRLRIPLVRPPSRQALTIN